MTKAGGTASGSFLSFHSTISDQSNVELQSTQNIQCLDPADQADLQEPISHELERLKDSTKAWIVCFAAFLIQVFDVGVLHVFGVFFVELLSEFGCSKATASWVGSLAYGITMLFGILASALMNRLGARPVAMVGSAICSLALLVSSFAPSIEMMFLTFSILYGLGASLAYTPTMCIADDYFTKYVSLATGIMTAGSSTGTLILSPISQWLVTTVGWRNAFRVLFGITLVCLWSGWMFKPLAPAPITNKQKLRHITVTRRLMNELQLWKNKVYVVYVAAVTSCMFGYYIPYVHLVSHAEDIGLTSTQGSMLIMILGGATATGRMLFGKIVEYGYLNRVHMHQMSMVISGTGCMLLPIFRSFFGLVCYVITVGLVDGCYVVLLPVLTTQLAGLENRVMAWGFLVGISSITFTLGPPVAGWISDATGSYDLAFHVAGIPVVAGAVILFFIPWAQRTGRSTNVMTAAASVPSPLYELGRDTSLADEEEVDMQVYSLDEGEPVPELGQDMVKIQTRDSCVIVDLSRQNVVCRTRRRCTSESAADGRGFPEDITRAITLLDRSSTHSTAGLPWSVAPESRGTGRRRCHSESTHDETRLPEDVLQAIAVLRKHSASLANLNQTRDNGLLDNTSEDIFNMRSASVTPSLTTPRAADAMSNNDGASLPGDHLDYLLTASNSQPANGRGSTQIVTSVGPLSRGSPSTGVPPNYNSLLPFVSSVDQEDTAIQYVPNPLGSPPEGGSYIPPLFSNSNLPTVVEEESPSGIQSVFADHVTDEVKQDLGDEWSFTSLDVQSMEKLDPCKGPNSSEH